MSHRDKWMKAMMLKYDTDEEGVRAIMRERQKKSRINYSGKGGFHSMDRQQVKELSARALKKRWGERND